jgi:sulfite exporter TauE/SafE
VVLLLGVWFLYKRLRERNKNCTHHAHENEVKNSALLGVGLLGGFIPCGEVIAIGLLSVSTQIFIHNMFGFLSGLIATLGIVMALGATVGHTLHALRHNIGIRIVTPILLILIGLYKLVAP